MTDETWMERAACRGIENPAIFFGTRDDGGLAVQEARVVCARCPVRDACLDYALTLNIKFGVWGGVGEKERRRLRRRRGLARPAQGGRRVRLAPSAGNWLDGYRERA